MGLHVGNLLPNGSRKKTFLCAVLTTFLWDNLKINFKKKRLCLPQIFSTFTTEAIKIWNLLCKKVFSCDLVSLIDIRLFRFFLFIFCQFGKFVLFYEFAYLLWIFSFIGKRLFMMSSYYFLKCLSCLFHPLNWLFVFSPLFGHSQLGFVNLIILVFSWN